MAATPTLVRSNYVGEIVPGYVDVDGTTVIAASVATPMPVSSPGSSPTNPNANPTTIYTAQQAVTASAVALAAHALVNGIVVKAKVANTGTVYVGPAGVTTATGFPLLPGEAISFGVTDASAVFVIVATLAADGVSVAGN